MTLPKRLFDIVLALVLAALLAVPFLVLCAVLLAVQGRPIFYVAERMRAPGQPFALWKLRTMRPAGPNEAGVSGGDKSARISPLGRALRKTRADEIPQLWNVLRGDMSFVGPRPPLRQYVERFPDLYAEVLKSRPGITGLASLHIHGFEERILAPCRTAEETDRVYTRRSIPRKARLDLIYQRHQSVCFDIALIWQTARRVLMARFRHKPPHVR
ncbi:sugar transferase [Falsirhodobacter algicola]|uniref:Sugar transferase n=1 Tax=Falsirhodobacter algicola TaxID=2692330 RepID=A0A8J8MSU9_9RHOB|nr:sugar transferase [Falsirhodobacter algicola]QUS36062.1 sugar transferase [Falsirhodobacter algicola]